MAAAFNVYAEVCEDLFVAEDAEEVEAEVGHVGQGEVALLVGGEEDVGPPLGLGKGGGGGEAEVAVAVRVAKEADLLLHLVGGQDVRVHVRSPGTGVRGHGDGRGREEWKKGVQ